MPEIRLNLHMHTSYSDGTGTHADIARAALESGLDAVIVTDHNVLVQGPEGYYGDDEQRVLLLIGEEVHDRTREPQKNHLLVFGAEEEMTSHARDPRLLVEAVQKAGGLSFLAHPVDPAAPAVDQPDISWVDWDIIDFTGIELWNGFSEFKSLLKSKAHALYYAYQPELVARGPFQETIQIWDKLLSTGKKIVAVGGSDAHALHSRMGPLRRTLFPYSFHFQAINTHLSLPAPLSGDVEEDKKMIYDALRNGHAFIGYDLPASTDGFRFYARGKYKSADMGDEISPVGGVTLQISLPLRTECLLKKDGEIIKQWANREVCTYITTDPGVYRVEATIDFKGQQRGWIYSNPIYVRE
jgi:hypothetical protein